MVSHSQRKAEEAISDLKLSTGREALFLHLDLSNLAHIKQSAETYLRNENRLDVLFNNAGVMWPSLDALTDDGYDLQFGVNVLGHFYLTKLLLPVIIETVKITEIGTTRIVNTSSFGHFASNLRLETVRDGAARRKMSTDNLYNQSKLGNVVFAQELARRYGDQGIVSTSLNPGLIRSDLQRNIKGIKSVAIDLLLHPTYLGATTQLWAGTSPEGAELNGKYLIPWARIGTASRNATSHEIGRELWDWLEDQVKGV